MLFRSQPRVHISWYIAGDILIAIATWACFYYLRTIIYNYPFSVPPGFYLGLSLYVLGWMMLHFLSGAYNNIYQKSRLNEMTRSIAVSMIGCLLLLFFFLLKNPQDNNQYYYLEFYSLLFPFLICTVIYRMLFLG